MSTKPIAGRVRKTCEFLKAHRREFSVQMMCRLLEVAPSGYYDWLNQPLSNRATEDARLLRLIRAAFEASQGVYGAPRVFLDLREAGETCSKHRVARLMRENKLRARHGYRTRRWAVGKPAVLVPNRLKRQFTVTRPNKAWVTDITYVRTWQGWLYLAVVMDLFSRSIVGWATRPTIHRELVLDAVLMAVRRRRSRGTLLHSDQDTQFGSDAWRRFCRSNHLEPSMSRKGNCWDNAVAESCFGSLKKERIKKQIYKNRDLAVADVADYLMAFYHRSRRHGHLGGVSPEQFEEAHNVRRQGVHQILGTPPCLRPRESSNDRCPPSGPHPLPRNLIARSNRGVWRPRGRSAFLRGHATVPRAWRSGPARSAATHLADAPGGAGCQIRLPAGRRHR